MRTIYIDSKGVKHYTKPNHFVWNGLHWYGTPTNKQLIESGWQIVEEEIATATPYVPTYEERVVALIRERYTLDAELAILRQRDSKPSEFAEYNTYCENCKQRAKTEE